MTNCQFKHTPLQPLQKYDIVSNTRYGKRIYTINKPCGTVLTFPSITTILGAQEKDWLKQWQQSLGKAKAEKEKNRCAKRGEIVHTAIESYLNNQPFGSELPVPERKLFNQIKPKLNRINNIYTQEEALFSEGFKIAGRVDCIGEYDGIPSIIDFKSSTSVKNDQLIQDYYLQCTAYAMMFYELYEVLIPQIVIIMCVEKGMVPLVFKKSVEDYVLPLTERINNYYKGAN